MSGHDNVRSSQVNVMSCHLRTGLYKDRSGQDRTCPGHGHVMLSQVMSGQIRE